eukprot:7019641-Pyramimonas_sp.AAC.1
MRRRRRRQRRSWSGTRWGFLKARWMPSWASWGHLGGHLRRSRTIGESSLAISDARTTRGAARPNAGAQVVSTRLSALASVAVGWTLCL